VPEKFMIIPFSRRTRAFSAAMSPVRGKRAGSARQGMGYLGILIPEEYGGSGGDYLMATVWCEECTRCGSGGVVAGLNMHALIHFDE